MVLRSGESRSWEKPSALAEGVFTCNYKYAIITGIVLSVIAISLALCFPKISILSLKGRAELIVAGSIGAIIGFASGALVINIIKHRKDLRARRVEEPINPVEQEATPEESRARDNDNFTQIVEEPINPVEQEVTPEERLEQDRVNFTQAYSKLQITMGLTIVTARLLSDQVIELKRKENTATANHQQDLAIHYKEEKTKTLKNMRELLNSIEMSPEYVAFMDASKNLADSLIDILHLSKEPFSNIVGSAADFKKIAEEASKQNNPSILAPVEN